jgi:hypothetical protein
MVLVLESMELMKLGVQPQEAISRVIQSNGIDKKLGAKLLDTIVQSTSSGAGKKVKTPLAFKRWYLENAYSPDGVKFSSRVNNLIRVDEIADTVRYSMRINESWKMAAQRLSDTGIQAGDVAKDITELKRYARKAYLLSDNGKAYHAYEAKINAVQRRINTLVNPSTSKLKRAYQNVIDATKAGAEEAAQKAMEYAVYFKQRYNAERIVRTEDARAYDQAFHSENLQNDDVVGFRSVLSSAHTVYDICDWWATADLYGMGPGVYPKENGPDIPHHPNCRCSLEAVYAGEVLVGSAQIIDKNAVASIRKLDAKQQRDLLGVRGRADFSKDPNGWRDLIKNYNEPTAKKISVPRPMLYGAEK